MFSPSSTTYRLVVPVDDAIDVHSLDTYVGPPVRSSSDSSRPQCNWLRAGGTDYYFLVFYEALVLWGYTATAATQDQTEGKIIFINFVDRHPLHSVLSLRHRPHPHHCHCLAQPGHYRQPHSPATHCQCCCHLSHTQFGDNTGSHLNMAGANTGTPTQFYRCHYGISTQQQTKNKQQEYVWCHQSATHIITWLVPLGWRCHKFSTQNLKQLSTALTGRVAWVNVQCFKCLGLTFR